MKYLTRLSAGILVFTFVLSLFAFSVPAQAAAYDTKNYHSYGSYLNYELTYDKKNNEVSFDVKNASYWPLYFSFSTAKKYDLVIYDYKGSNIWQLSQGKFYTQAFNWDWFNPGESKSYKSELPQLETGEYTVVAYYNAQGINTAVTSLKINVKKEITKSRLNYDAWYSGGNDHKIILAVRNLTKSPIKVDFPGTQRYDVQLKGANGFSWRYSANKVSTPALSSDTLKAGLNRFYYIYLPDLPKGRYTAKVYYLGYSSRTPAETITFTVK